MAKFPIQRAPERLGTIPPVRATIDVDTGGQLVAEAAAGLGGAIADLGLRWDLINAKTQLAEADIAASDTINKYFLELQGNNEPNTYGERLNQLFGKLETLTPNNRRAANVYRQNLARQKLTVGRQTRDAARGKIESNAQSADFLLLQKAKESGDFTKYKASIINGVKLGIYNAKEAETLLDDADRERDTKEKNDIFGIALSQRNDEGILDVKEANKTINESKLLTTSEKADLSNQITSRSIQEKNQRDEVFNERTGQAIEGWFKELEEGILTDTKIIETDLKAVGEQKTKEVALKRQWQQILQDTIKLTEPLVSNETVYDSLVVGSEQVERGTKSPAEWDLEYAQAWASGDLEKEDRRGLRIKDIVATKTMQNRAFSEGTTNNYSRLVELRDDELSRIVSMRDAALEDEDLKTVNALNFSIKKAQIQKWNYGRFRTELRGQIAQNENWSQKQIFTATDILAENYDKPIADLMLEFEKTNPNQSILKTSPDIEFKDIWNDLPDEDKAKVWELRLLGVPTKEILGAI